MLRFIGKRLLMMVPVLLGVIFIVFTMVHFSPGRTADYMLDDMATEEQKLLFEKENGLDKPFFVQYFKYVANLLKGDMGVSWMSKREVLPEILARFPNSLKMALMGSVFAVILGVTLGIVSATKQYSIWDNIVRVISIIGVSMPGFWEGMMLIILFSAHLGWLPPSGFSSWKHYIMPTLTIGTMGACNIMRMTRSSMLEAIRQDYIRTARAKGQTERIVIWKHALQNALIPIITVAGITLGRLLGGIAIAESVFAIAGIGKMVVDAIPTKNAPLVQGAILFIAIATSLINLVTDVIYAYVDPRIRSQYVKRREKLPAKEAV